MNPYREIDDWVLAFKSGQKCRGDGLERERARAACGRLLMAFKPLVLSTMTGFHVPGDQFEDAYQE